MRVFDFSFFVFRIHMNVINYTNNRIPSKWYCDYNHFNCFKSQMSNVLKMPGCIIK